MAKINNEISLINEIGNRIRTIRIMKELSQEKTAELADIHHSYLARIEKGDSNPSLKIIIRIANALDVMLIDIFADQSKSKSSKLEFEFFEKLSQEDKAIVLDKLELLMKLFK